MGAGLYPLLYAGAAANLLTIDAVDPLAKIPEYQACAVRITLARDEELADPSTHQPRARY